MRRIVIELDDAGRAAVCMEGGIPCSTGRPLMLTERMLMVYLSPAVAEALSASGRIPLVTDEALALARSVNPSSRD